ncbi:MAG TPA: hypothetical protein VJ802_06445 [Gemmatimonadaceae bacterium]|nr:hypothetical protein [Gemmatimonadaceae bacterium]
MADIVDPVITRGPHDPGPLSLWAPIVGPMVATLVMLESAYALVGPSCRRGTSLFLHLVAATMLLATILVTTVAVRVWRERGRDWETHAGGAATRTRFMAVVGLLSGVSGALLILAQWLAIFFHHPCAIS